MIEDQILQEFLENAVQRARRQIQTEGKLTVETAMPILLKSQFNHIVHLDNELKALSERITQMATKEDIRNMATKEDIRNMATKEDIRNMATKEDIRNMATKEDIHNMATRDDIRNMATKDDIHSLQNWMMLGLGIITIILGLISILFR
jgi:hypothetical protein